MKKNYQLLCTDVDGTLLDSKGQISEANHDAVTSAIRAGKKVVLASGRTWRSLKFYEKKLGIYTPGQFGIALNGGAVYEIVGEGEVKLLHRDLMPAADAQEIFTTMAPKIAPYNEMHMLAYNNEGILIAEESLKSSRLYSEMIRLGAQTTPSYTELPGDIYKILIHGNNEDLREIASFTTTQFAKKCQSMFSANSLLELIPIGVDKGRGISFLAMYLGIPIEEVIALGDEENDIAMLLTAGLGIAVANAVPEAAAAADVHLTVSNDKNALAAAIEKYLIA